MSRLCWTRRKRRDVLRGASSTSCGAAPSTLASLFVERRRVAFWRAVSAFTVGGGAGYTWYAVCACPWPESESEHEDEDDISRQMQI